MGGINSKLRKYVENGDEESSLKLITEHNQLIKHFNANEPINEMCETALLLCCKWSMTTLVKTLLYECNGNPNKKNILNQTAVHLICQIPLRTDSESDYNLHSINDTKEQRSECLQLILDWNKVCATNKLKNEFEMIDINSLDRNGNTALHLAASNDLFKCVEILVDNKCDLLVENEAGDTACELAAKFNHSEILKYLEFKIVFSDQSNQMLSNSSQCLLSEDYSCLNSYELEELKNQLVFEVSNILNVSFSTAEVLLRSFEWSQELLIDVWFNDSENFAKTEHMIPIHDNQTLASEEYLNEKTNQKTNQKTIQSFAKQIMKLFCEICSLEIDTNESLESKCGHHFCFNCWRTYLELKIESGETHAITCPAFNCSYLVTVEVIAKVVSPNLKNRFVQNDIEAFIESNPSINWCPFPGCNKAVYFPQSKLSLSDEQSHIFANMPPLLPISHAVDCGSGHYFCWECKREAHSPCGCKLWEEWILKISDIKAEELKQTYSKTEDAANCLWLVRNAKQCPRCKTHIQKSEGCNHLRCTKCKYDFCWICLESWKKHNSGTGGYFRCNRSEAAQKAEQNLYLLKRVTEEQNCEMKELKKFVFHYTKYKFNILSNSTELSLIEKSRDKQKELYDYYLELGQQNDCQSVEPDDQFLYCATLELIRARKILCGSAVYGYYLEDHGYNKAVFEYMENNLNYISNRLSDILTFDYLRTSRSYIIDLTNKVNIKRLELLSAVCKGLIPPETPPHMKTHQRRHCLPGVLALDSMENLCNPCDENDNSLISQAIISSLSDFSDNNSWIQDKNGRHNNLLAIYDWPDDCHVDYADYKTDDKHFGQTLNVIKTESEVCSNPYCKKPKVKNPRTGETHDFCSLKCKYLTTNTDNEFEDRMNYESDRSMDLLLAIEMSKLSLNEQKENHLLIENDTKSIDSDINKNAFELFVESIKSDSNLNESSNSSAKTAIMFFLKSSFNEIIDQKNIKSSVNDIKTEKQLFSSLK